MKPRDLSSWMWGDALTLLERAERLRRQFFETGSDASGWEPPVDVVETEEAIIIYVAMPGVPPERVAVSFEPDAVTVAGVRRFPAPPAARIRRIEIPYGRFVRRIPLPLHALEPASRELVDGCLALMFRKIKENRDE